MGNSHGAPTCGPTDSGYWLQIRPHHTATDAIRVESSRTLPFLAGRPFTGTMRLAVTNDVSTLEPSATVAPTALVAAARARCHTFLAPDAQAAWVIAAAGDEQLEYAALQTVNTKANAAAAAAAAHHPILALNLLHFKDGRLVRVDEQAADALFVDVQKHDSAAATPSPAASGVATPAASSAMAPSSSSSGIAPAAAAGAPAPADGAAAAAALAQLEALEPLVQSDEMHEYAPSSVPQQPSVFVLRLHERLDQLERLRSEHQRPSSDAGQPNLASESSSGAVGGGPSTTPHLFLVSDWQLPGTSDYAAHFGELHASGGVAGFRRIPGSGHGTRVSETYVLHASRPFAEYPVNAAEAAVRVKAQRNGSVMAMVTNAVSGLSISALTREIWQAHKQQSSIQSLISRLERAYAQDDELLWTVLQRHLTPAQSAGSSARAATKAAAPDDAASAPKLSQHIEAHGWDVEYACK